MGCNCSFLSHSPSSPKSPNGPDAKNPHKPSQPTGKQSGKHNNTTNSVKHLFVLIHGNNGFPAQMFAMKKILEEKFGSSADAFVPACNSRNTFHGVAAGAQNIVSEFKETFLKNKPYCKPNGEKIKFSVIAHSLGGLYARHFIRDLYVEQRGLWDTLVPTSFLTCNSPHLGSVRPVTDFKSWVVSTGADIYSKIIGKTGADLFLESNLLMEMSEPGSDFVQALEKFPHRTLVGVAQGDFVVSLASAVCRNTIPYPRASSLYRFTDPAIYPNPMEVVAYSGFSETYQQIFKSFESKFKSTEAEVPQYHAPDTAWDVDSIEETKFRPQMLTNMNKIGFRRIEMQFHVYEKRFVLNGSLHGMTLSIEGKLGDAPFMEMSSRENSGPISIDLLSDMLRMDHGAMENAVMLQKQS